MAKKNTGSDFIGIGIGLEVNEQANTAAANAINKTTEEIAKSIKKTAESFSVVDKAAESTAKKLQGFLKIDDKDTKSLAKLAEVVNSAFQFAGVDAGMKKINTMKDMMVQVGNEIAQLNSKAAAALVQKSSPDFSNIKLFSIEKFKSDVDLARGEYQKLLDLGAKGGIKGGNINAIGKELVDSKLFTTVTADVRNLRSELGKGFELKVKTDVAKVDTTKLYADLDQSSKDIISKLTTKYSGKVADLLINGNGTKLTHLSSNMGSVSNGFDTRKLGTSFARKIEEEMSSPTLKEAAGKSGRVYAELFGKGLDYGVKEHKKVIENIFKDLDKLLAKNPSAKLGMDAISVLRQMNVDFVNNWNSIGKAHEMHVLNGAAVKIKALQELSSLKGREGQAERVSSYSSDLFSTPLSERLRAYGGGVTNPHLRPGVDSIIPTKSLEAIQGIRDRIAEVSKATSNMINYNDIEAKATKLRRAFYDIVPAGLKKDIDGLFTTKWEESIAGTQKFSAALAKVKDNVLALNSEMKLRGEKVYTDSGALRASGTASSSYAVPSTAITNIARAQRQAEAQDAIVNSLSDKNNRSLQSGILAVSRDYDTLNKKVETYNKLNAESISNGSKNKWALQPMDFSSIIDKNGLRDAQEAVKGLRKSLNDGLRDDKTEDTKVKQFKALQQSIKDTGDEYLTLIKKMNEHNKTAPANKQFDTSNVARDYALQHMDDSAASRPAARQLLKDYVREFNDFQRSSRSDNVLEKRMEALNEATRKSSVSMEDLRNKSAAVNKTFENVTKNTTTNTDPQKLADVRSAQATVANQIATSTGTKPEIDAIRDSIAKLNLAMQEYRQTGSRIKDSTGSPFDNLTKGVPTQLVTLDLMKQKIRDALVVAKTSMQDLDSASLGKINKQLKDMGYQINSTTKEFEKLAVQKKGGIFSWLPESLGGMAGRLAEFYSLRTVIFAVSNQFRESTKAAIEHNQAVHDILGISGEAKVEFGAVSDSIYSIAKSSRFSAQEVGGLMQVLAQAGVKSKDLGEVSKQTGIFATATASDPKMAADLVTTSLNVYAIKATEVTRVTNAMTAALNLSKLETAGLSTAFNYLAPQSAQLGMSMEQTLAIIANMAQSGIKASTIGTGVSQMLKEFAAPKPRLRNLLKEAGLSPEDINPMKHNFADIVDKLKSSGVTVDKLFQAMETRVGRAAVTAINLSGESFREMEANLTGTHAALTAYDKTMEGAKARMNVTKQSFQELSTIIGEQLAPALIWVNGALQDFIKILSSDQGSMTKLAVEVTLVGAAIIGLTLATNGLMKSAVFSGAVTPLISGFKMAAAGVTAFIPTAHAAALAIKAISSAGLIIPTIMSAASIAVGGLGAAIATAFPYLVVAGIIVGIGVAIYKLVDAMGAERREKEATTKASLEKIDADERLIRTSNGIANSTKDSSKAFAEYNKAIASGVSHHDALSKVKDTSAKATTEQMAELVKFVAKGGPMAAEIQGLIDKNEQLKVQIIRQRQLKLEGATTTRNAISEHNAALAGEGLNNKAIQGATSRLNMSAAQVGAVYNDPSDKNNAKVRRVVDGLYATLLEEFEKKHPEFNKLATMQTSFESVDIPERDKKGNVKKDKRGNNIPMLGEDGKPLQQFVPTVVTTNKYGVMGTSPILPPDQVVTGAPSAEPGKKGDPVTRAADNLLKVIDLRIKEAETALSTKRDNQNITPTDYEGMKRDTTLTPKEVEALYHKMMTATKQSDLNMDSLTIADRNNLKEVAVTGREDAKLVKLNQKKVTAADPIINKELGVATTSASEEQLAKDVIAYREKISKLGADADANYIKQVEEDSKRLATAKRNALNTELGDAYTSEERRQKAFEDYIAAEKERLHEESVLRIASVNKTYFEIEAYNKTKEGLLTPKKFPEGVKETYNKSVVEGGKYEVAGLLTATKVATNTKNTGVLAAETKDLDIAAKRLTTSNELLENQKSYVVGADAINKLDVQKLENEIESLGTQKTIVQLAKSKLVLTDAEAVRQNAAQDEKLAKLDAEIAKQQRIKELLEDQSFLGNFTQGARSAWNQQSDFKGATNALGSNMVNTGINGVSDSIFNTFGTSQAKLDEKAKIKEEIGKLNIQKHELEASITSATAGGFMTPEMAAKASQQKIQLTEVNKALKVQEDSLKKLGGGWKNFADSLKKVMVQILEELQKYIIKMLVVAMVKKIAGLAMGNVGGETGSMPDGQLSGDLDVADKMPTFAKGGMIQKLAAGGSVLNGTLGGFVPTDQGYAAGKDSVRIHAMPGEYMVRKSSVDYYGRDFMEKINEQKLADGGLVGAGNKAPKGSDSGGGQAWNLTIINVADPSTIPQQPVNTNEILNIISFDAAKRGVVHKVIKGVMAS